MKEIVYCPPPFEDIQNEVTRFSDNVDAHGNKIPLCVSYHSDLSLLLNIEKAHVTKHQLEVIEDALKPCLSSNAISQFEEKYGSISDEELLSSCPSRYISTQSEKMRYLKDLAEKDIQAKKDFAEKAKDAEEKAEYQRQEKEFRDKFRKLFGE
jgi:hypothetical protein